MHSYHHRVDDVVHEPFKANKSRHSISRSNKALHTTIFGRIRDGKDVFVFLCGKAEDVVEVCLLTVRLGLSDVPLLEESLP